MLPATCARAVPEGNETRLFMHPLFCNAFCGSASESLLPSDTDAEAMQK